MRILNKVEASVLWLWESSTIVVRNLRNEAAARGIAPERLVFAPKVEHADYLARHRLADLCLDTLPYNGHATTSDALWAGLPVLTCLGITFAGRVAASLLSAIGLNELITHSLEEYEALALELATNPKRLAEIRTKLAKNRDTYPLFNTDRFRRHIEAAYTRMWERCQKGEPPESFAVEPIDK
jgi:predicted O-linked N-acetylglucosamine transferase (SPINDLY family)